MDTAGLINIFRKIGDLEDAFCRVAKCHGYDGYICVKKLEGWGKKSGRIHIFAKPSIG